MYLPDALLSPWSLFFVLSCALVWLAPMNEDFGLEFEVRPVVGAILGRAVVPVDSLSPNNVGQLTVPIVGVGFELVGVLSFRLVSQRSNYIYDTFVQIAHTMLGFQIHCHHSKRSNAFKTCPA